MVYGSKPGGRRGVEYCAIVLQSYCNRVGNAGGERALKGRLIRARRVTLNPVVIAFWPLQDIAKTNCVWCTAYKRVVGGDRILRNSRATVLQSCGQCRWGGARKG